MIENIMLPTYIPESLSFVRLKIHVCPVRNPDELLAGRSATIYYVDNNFDRVSFSIYHKEAWEILGGWDLFFPQHWWDGTHGGNAIETQEIEINGHSGYLVYWDGFSEYEGEYRWFSTLLVYVEDMVYFIYGRLEPVQLVRMVESLR